MRLSTDIFLTDVDNSNELYGIHNYHINAYTFVHKEIYNYLSQCSSINDFTKLNDDLTDEQISNLVDNGVLMINEEDYANRSKRAEKGERKKCIKTAYLHITMMCNLSCDYCYIADQTNKQREELSAEKWKTALDLLKKQGLESVTITGGEPLIYQNIREVISYARFLGLQITLLSNGTLIKENKDLLSIVDKCIISLDGLKSEMRKGINSTSVLEDILCVTNEYRDKLVVRSVITKGSENDVNLLGELLQVHSISHTKIPITPCSICEFELIPDYIANDLLDSDLGFPVRCGAGDTVIAISSDGNIYPCQMMVKEEFLICNIFDADWLEKYKMNNINDILADASIIAHEKCNNCIAKSLCNGNCRATAFNVYSDITAINEYFCDFCEESAKKTIKRFFEDKMEAINGC